MSAFQPPKYRQIQCIIMKCRKGKLIFHKIPIKNSQSLIFSQIFSSTISIIRVFFMMEIIFCSFLSYLHDIQIIVMIQQFLGIFYNLSKFQLQLCYLQYQVREISNSIGVFSKTFTKIYKILLNETDFQSLQNNQIPLSFIEKIERKMRKVQQINNQSNFLPNIIQCSSRNNLRHSQHNNSKENIQIDRHHFNRASIPSAHHCLSKKNYSNGCALFLDEILQLKLLEPIRVDQPTKPKMNRPWVGKQIDLNKETTKSNRLQSILKKEGNSHILRRKSCQQDKAMREGQNIMQVSEAKIKNLDIQTTQLQKNITKRTISVTREKIYSCKIAMKNCVFPIDKKKFEQAKLVEYFEKEQTISTIHKNQTDEDQDVFISIDTYINMAL